MSELTQPKPLRIAIVLDDRELSCRSTVSRPFSLEGYPHIELELFSRSPGERGGFEVKSLPELHPEAFDLILDGDFLTKVLPGFPEKPELLVSGPLAPFLEDLVCQLREIRQKQEINLGIINSATDAIVTITEDHVIVGYNQGAEKIFGYSRAEALGRDLSIIIPPPHKEAHRDYVRRFIATREPHVIGKHVRLNAQRRDGSEFPMSISFSVAEIGGELYFTGIVREMTEQKQMEDRLVQSERLAAIGNTVAHIAHEIKNPLAIMGGFAKQLLRATVLDDKAKQKLGIISEEVDRLEKMVAEMRNFVRRPPARMQFGHIDATLHEALELFRDAFKERHIKLRRVGKDRLPGFNLDPDQMHQVLINLLKNAMEAMPQGGELTVTTRKRGANLEIAIQDTGVGMTQEVVANLFQPYFTTKEAGTGLGLAVCQSIIQEHGGLISVESAPGQGSTFTIRLPIAEPAAA